MPDEIPPGPDDSPSPGRGETPEDNYGARLLDQHQQYLRERGVPPRVASERGYFSADTKVRLKQLGFTESQQLVPALVIPVRDVTGERVGYQLRPDHPRMVNGRTTKFETPRGAGLHLDVPPSVRGQLGNPDVPLLFTEGAVKADAAAARGLACVALFGVYGWRTKNEWGGSAVMPELEYLHLKGRQVWLAFDSDIMLKSQVHDALSRFYRVLERKGADVGVVMLPTGEHAEKCGLDDYFVRGGTVEDLASRVQKELPRSPGEEPEPDDDVESVVDARATLGGLLEGTEAYFRRYIVFASEHEARAIALWVAHCWLLEAFDVTPRLLITAPTKRAGKSRVLDVLQRVVPRGKRFGSASGASMFRAIDKLKPVLLIDEIDRVFRHTSVDQGSDLIAQVVNIGWERGNPAVRVDGPDREVVEFETFAPMALAGIDKGSTVPDTVIDRSVLIGMRRRLKHEPVERFRRRGSAATTGQALKGTWKGYLEANPDLVMSLSGAEPELPNQLHDRAQDAWEPLVAIADAAGGPWPAWARAAAVALTTTDDEDDGWGVALMRDLARVWPEGRDAVPSRELVELLNGLEDAPWAGWSKGKGITQHSLARQLDPFGIRPGPITIVTHHDKRGYERAAFTDAWGRYCPQTGVSGGQSVPVVPTLTGQGSNGDADCPTDAEPGTLQSALKPLPDKARDGWDSSDPGNTPYGEVF